MLVPTQSAFTMVVLTQLFMPWWAMAATVKLPESKLSNANSVKLLSAKGKIPRFTISKPLLLKCSGFNRDGGGLKFECRQHGFWFSSHYYSALASAS
jgi:hypothetical protein